MKAPQATSYQKWWVRLADGTQTSVIFSGRTGADEGSPLKGYEADGQWLHYKGQNKWKQRCIGFLTALILGGITVGILALSGSFKPVEEEAPAEDGIEQLTLETASAPSAPMIESLQEAADYLDRNNVWEKKEMERYKALQGLYDDLNNFNLERIYQYWGERLKASSKFEELASHVIRCQTNGWHPEYKTTGGTFNEPEVETLTVQHYMNWVDNQCRTATAPN